ncbi:hypothetical protein H4R35_005049 [Dimargaris xerosporica]|nr:hypothetical protein H4R35_005049 [Dimargaris xerosporica]
MADTIILRKKVVKRVFLALLLDILAFTTVLPLFPKLLHSYQERGNSALLNGFVQTIQAYKALVTGQQVASPSTATDTVLVGGLLGSVFSFLQFLVSPIIGRLSDRYGRRPVLLGCMVGNIAAALVWLFATDFTTFLAARILGGLSEGNVQLSHAMITDITPEAERSKSLAWVGIAFAIGFTLGPPLSAYLVSLDTKISALVLGSPTPSLTTLLSPFPWPAVLTVVLLLLELLYIYWALPETVHYRHQATAAPPPASPVSAPSAALTKAADKDHGAPRATPLSSALVNIRRLQYTHFWYLLVFSGMEFTLPFLTFEKYHFTPMQQGQFLGMVGILSALLQGGVIRRVAHRWGEKRMVALGMASCVVGFLVLALDKGPDEARWGFRIAIVCLAITSATVVNCLTSLVSLFCTATTSSKADLTATADVLMQGNQLATKKGQVLGDFRSMGQLGRSLGPVLACTLYWLYGSATAYAVGSTILAVILVAFQVLLAQPVYQLKRKTA